MRTKKVIGLAVTVGMLGSGCSTVKRDVARWHEAEDKEVSRFVSGVQPFRGNPDSHYLIACYYQDKGDQLKAIDEFKKALLCKPDYVKAYNGLGVSYDQLGDFSKAVESYRAALRIHPGLDYIHNNLGYSYLMQERIEEAIGLLRTPPRSTVRTNGSKIIWVWPTR